MSSRSMIYLQRMFCVVVVLLLSATTSWGIAAGYSANSNEYIKSSFSTENGLSQNDVNYIMQDSYGLIWVATNNGINIFDSYTFKTITKGERGLGSNLILTFQEDEVGNVWIGSADRGLFYYVRNENRIYHYLELCDDDYKIQINVVRSITSMSSGAICVSDRYRAMVVNIYYDPTTAKISSITHSVIGAQPTAVIFSSRLIDDILYVGTSQGLYRRDKNTEQFELVTTPISRSTPAHIYTNANQRVTYIVQDEDLFRVNWEANSRSSDLSIGCLIFCLNGRTGWIANRKGLYRVDVDPITGELSNLHQVDSYNEYLPTSIICDNCEGVWVGFERVGLKRYELNQKPFYKSGSFGNSIATGIEQHDEQVWIGTDGSGVHIFEGDSCVHQLFLSTPIVSVERSRFNNKMYVSSDYMLYEMDDDYQPKVIQYGMSYRKVLGDSCFLWLATYEHNLLRYDLRDGSSVTITNRELQRPIVMRNLLKDSRGDLYVGTDCGLMVIDSKECYGDNPTLRMVLDGALQDHYILPIEEDYAGRIWYGTLGDGLHSLSPSKDGFTLKSYTTHDGLPNNSIKAIEEDNRGLIWGSTNSGLFALNPQNSTVKSYNVVDGLQDNEFSELSSTKLRDGRIIFGGVKGYNSFDPNAIGVDSMKINLVLTDFAILNESITQIDLVKGVGTRSSEMIESVVLPHDKNSFSLSFAALRYINTQFINYIYTLEGFDNGYMSTSLPRANYTNVPPGHYTFRVEVSNSDDVKSACVLEIPITIKPPFWGTWYAIVLMMILFYGLVHLAVVSYKDRLERNNRMALIELEKSKVSEMLDMRTQLMSNISYGFKTPLTLILTSLQSILSDSKISTRGAKSRHHFETVVHNSNRLMRLIDEMINLTKQQSGRYNIELERCDFVEHCRGVFMQFMYWAEQSGVTLKFNAPDSPLEFYIDKYHIEQIVMNLVSNALKHTTTNGVIDCTIKREDQSVVLTVFNTGVGVCESERRMIFNRYFSNYTNPSDNSLGTGVGLSLCKELVELHRGVIDIDSTEGVGTTFILKLPMLLEATDHLKVKSSCDDTLKLDSVGEASSVKPLLSDDGSLYRLLIVNDDAPTMEQLTDLFGDFFEVVSATNREECFALIESAKPHIILLDMVMPDSNMLELCQSIKSAERSSHIPVVILSVESSDRRKAESFRAHADSYCTKPFINSVLIERLNSIVTNRLSVSNFIKSSSEESIINDLTTNDDRRFMKRLIEFIDENMHDDALAVSDVCEHIGLSQITLNKRLKSMVNMTANVLIRTRRLKRAAELLKTGRYSISEITHDVGFYDLRYFRDCFKKEYGVSPKEFKATYCHVELSDDE